MNIRKVLLLLIISCMFFQNTAFAYIDPSSGSMVIQMAIGAILATVYFLKDFFISLKYKIFGGKKKTEEED